MALNLEKMERIESKLAALRQLLRDPDLVPFLPILLEEEQHVSNEAPVIPVSDNGEGDTSAETRGNGQCIGIRAAIRAMSERLPSPFTRQDVYGRLRQQHFLGVNENAVRDALNALVKQGEIEITTPGRGGSLNEYDFVR